MKKLSLLFSFLIAAFFSFQSTATAQNKVKGSGPVVTETVNMGTISSIGLGISANVYLKQGNQQKIEISGQKNVIDIITKESTGDTWKIGVKKGYSYSTKEKLEIHITIKDLEDIALGGSGSIYGESRFTNLDDLDISIGGSGSVSLDVEADDLDCNIGGSGSIKLKGSADDLSANIGGSGSIKALELQVESAKVNAAGSGSVSVHVTDHLDASIVGSGGVKYKGNPKISKSIQGSGRLKAI